MGDRRSFTKNMLYGALGGAAAAYAYIALLRPWHLCWGANDIEVAAHLPGDDLLDNPKIRATHAVTIQAPPSAVWPWLAQIGQGRGGFYSYEWIENLLGADIHNTSRILPEHQSLKVGDLIPLAQDGIGMPVAICEPDRMLVLHGDTRLAGSVNMPPVRPGEFLAASWGFYLFERPAGGTRLVERWLADWNPSLQNSVFYRIFLEPGAFIMERRMLLGIKHRAEKSFVDLQTTTR